MNINNTDPSSLSPPNWLAFSLSSNLPSSSSSHNPSHDQLSLFQAFNTNSSTTTNPVRNVVDPNLKEEDGATHLSIFTGGPKLEDFLGGSSTSGPAPHHQQQQLGLHQGHLISSESQVVPVTLSDCHEIYDSELKSIAAGFLSGFSTTFHQQTDLTHKQQQQQQQKVVTAEPAAPKKTVSDTFGQRTSIYRGVTRHRWTGRYEAHLWDNSCRREGQSRKGRQVYLGGYDKEEKAARAYDLAALKYWGQTTTTNFPIANYGKELEDMKNMTRQEFVASLRRKSSGFSRGASIYRGVTRHHQHGRWQARIGRVAGNKDLYLGTFSTQEEAAEAYDIAAIKFRGLNAVTNFDMSRYDVKSIAKSNLPIGGITNKSKNSSTDSATADNRSIDGGCRSDDRDHLSSASSVTFASQPSTAAATNTSNNSTLSFAIPIKQDPSYNYWSNILGYNNSLYNSKIAPITNGSNFQNPNTAFNMEFSSAVNESNINNGFFSGGYVDQQSGISNSSGSSTIPFATPIALHATGGNSTYEGYSWNNNSAPSLHTYQAAKPNLSVFQTPIFGME